MYVHGKVHGFALEEPQIAGSVEVALSWGSDHWEEVRNFANSSLPPAAVRTWRASAPGSPQRSPPSPASAGRSRRRTPVSMPAATVTDRVTAARDALGG
ncbi:hypothetical protein IPZ70_20265 [Streptomyces polychromogenes]|nr:hypothetical protein [Streptomyces polychromogenes]